MKRVDLGGKRFGRLIAICATDNRRGSSVMWECLCDCGKTHYTSVDALRSGRTVSCGCYKHDKLSLNTGISAFNALYRHYRHNAEVRGYAFELSENEFEFLTSQPCFYCGEEPSNSYNRPRLNGSYCYNGIDRLDSSAGYLFKNCVPCCKICNYAKGTMSVVDFILWSRKIYLKFSNNLDKDTFCDIINYVDDLKKELDEVFLKNAQ